MSTIQAINVTVSGFDPNTKYKFIFKNNGGNWPVRVSPLSGVFFPNSVKSYIYFCSNSGECPESDPNVFYNVPENSLTAPGLDLDNKSLYTILDLEIRDNNSDELLYTHPCVMQCDQCIPKLSLSFNNDNGDLSLTKDDGNSKRFNVKCDGLIPNQEYTYVLSGGGGNWPLKITPRSGIITTSSSDFTINGLLSFCPSTGACPSTDPSIINYQNIENRRFSEDPYSIVDVSLVPNDDTFQNKIAGSFSATCLDCIPAIQILSPNFINIGSNNSNNEFEVTVNNLVIGERYNYSFAGLDGNWPLILSPQSGSVVATSDSMKIPVVATFCTATGLCPSGSPGIMPYTNLRSSSVALNSIKKQSRFKMSLNQNAYATPVAYSNDIVAVCNDCLPLLKARLPSSTALSLGDGNYVAFNLQIENMVPGIEYQYVFKNIDSNWPAIINPLSGSIIRNNDGGTTQTVPASVTLCQSTGLCPNGCANVLTYTAAPNCNNKIARFKAEVTAVGYDIPSVNSNSYIVTCNDCIPMPSAVLPNVIVDSDNEKLFNVIIDNLSPTSEYRYKFISLDSNWPVSISPISGVITSASEHTLSVSASFCQNTGVCPNGSPNILPYTAGSSKQFNFGSLNKFAKIRLEIDPVLPSNNDSATVYSNEAMIKCSGCIQTPTITVPKEVTIGLDNFATINISGANLSPNTEYKYKLLSLDSNWPTVVNPVSGSVVKSSTCNIPVSVSFCASTGICPDGNKNILSYNISTSYNQFTLSSLQKSSKFQVQFDPVDDDLPIVYSNESLIRCSGCLPDPEIILPDTVVISDNNPKKFFISGINLLDGVEYRYRFIGLDSNWPTVLNPISGNIISSTSVHIPIEASFCVSTGVCSNGSKNVLDYTLANENQYKFNLLSKTSKIKLELIPNTAGLPTVYSNETAIICSGCLPEPEVVLPDTIVVTNINPVKFFMSGINLLEGVEYTYKFIGLDSNWPTMVNPISGTIISSKSFNLPIETSFCASTGICPSSSKNVLNYTLANNSQYTIGLLSKVSKAKLELTPNIAGLQKIYSNETKILCSGCLNPLSAEFKPSLINNPSKNNQNNNIKLNFNGLVPGVEYSYVLEPVKNNWPMTVNPISGTLVSPNTSGEATIYYDICYSTGLCPSDSLYVLPYTYTSDSENRKQFNVRAKVKTLNSSLLEAEAFSNIFSIRCDNADCLPKITISGIPATGGINFRESYRITSVIKNLLPDIVYSYKYKSLDANWPSIVYPASGIIRNASGYEIPTSIQFCKSTGLCPNNGNSSVLAYDLDSVCQTTNNELAFTKYVNFLLEVEPLAVPGLSKVYSNTSLLTMTNNIGGLEITYNPPLNTDGGTVIGSNDGITLNSVSNGAFSLRTKASGLLVGEKYEYSVNYLDSNWPVVITPQSGSFIATQDNKIIYTDVGFCFPSGECSINTKDVILKYRTNSLYNKNRTEFVTVNISVQQSGCPQSIAYGKDYKIECNDCVPNNPVSVAISGGPLLNLGSCCSGTRLMLVNIKGASSSDRYKYEFSSLTNNVTFNQPSSGYLTFTKNGSGVIMGIANTSLDNYDEGVVRFKLSNENNGIEANDYLGLKCGPNECAT